MNEPILIVGGGHAAAALCAALVDAGQGARVHLVCDEPHLPYQRPPLSKGYLKAPTETVQFHRTEAWFTEHGVTVHLGSPVVGIDRPARTAQLASGASLRWGQLVLATGTRARRLPALPEGLANVAVLRSATDAGALRDRLAQLLAQGQRLTVLGGGFIGLEIAATARHLGLEVEVLEGAPRLLARSVSAPLAAHVQQFHEASGTRLRLGVKVDGFEIAGGRLAALQVDGVQQPVDQLVLGIGAVANTQLAEAAGLAVADGIVVDAALRTSDPAILAIGDCARFPRGAGQLRLESVQNANDQARSAAATLLGKDSAYAAVPWFWSEQGGLRLQMVGILTPGAQAHPRPGANAQSASWFHYEGERLVCVESANAPMDHLIARRLLEAGKSPPPAQVSDPAVPLKTLV